MGLNNRQRRAAKAKRKARQTYSRQWAGADGGGTGSGSSERMFSDVERISFALNAAVDALLHDDEARLERFVDALATHVPALVARQAEDELRRCLPRLWDTGWQPAELVRQARRGSARTGRVMVAAVLVDHSARAPHTLHPQFAAQIREIGEGAPALGPRWLEQLLTDDGLAGRPFVEAAVEALAACHRLGPLPCILPPPGASVAAGAVAHGATDDPLLVKVRALLAQAESTTYEAEAETFTAKAQELMARHSIDVALVWAAAGRDERPTTIRIPIDDPYADAKSLLLQIVAQRSRCRAIYHGNYAMSSVTGFASDVAAVEVLFTSLLVQSQVALRAESASAGPGSRVRSRSFRASFLLAYANRIDQRLAAINRTIEAEAEAAVAAAAATDCGSLLPVLAARDDIVDEAFDAMFDRIVTTPVRGQSDAFGWARGAMAADQAKLAFGDLHGEADAGSAPRGRLGLTG